MKYIFNTGIFLLAIIFSACQKDLDMFVADPVAGPDSTWYNTITGSMPVATLKEDIKIPVSKDSFTFGTVVTNVTTASGMQCIFPPGSLMNNGQLVTGNINLETYLLKKKGDMIRMGTPTVSNNRLLVSGGELFIRLLKDGSELQVSPQSLIRINYDDAPIFQQMRLFYGDESNPSAFNWLPVTDSAGNNVIPSIQSYQILTNRLRWLNCDYFYDTTGSAQTIVSPVLPSNYTNANSMAYLVFNDMRSVVPLYGNATTRRFRTGNLPVNKPVTLIVISKQGDNYFLGHEDAITSGNSGTIAIQDITVTPVITSLNNIKAYLDSL